MDRSDAALAYLALGYSILPVLPGDKRPAMEWKRFQQEYAAEEEVREWWQRWPDANVGIVTGSLSGISVIDVDGQVGIESIGQQPIKPPTTRVIKTPRGWHLYYKYRSDWHTGAGLLPGIDVRNDGGYVVGPPSQVDGLTYTVFRDNPVAEITLPMSVFQPHNRSQAAPTATLVEPQRPTWVRDALGQGAKASTRNDTATRLIGYFHSLGTPKDVIEVILAEFAAKCEPPMDVRELAITIESVTRYRSKVAAARIAEPPQFQEQGDMLVYTWPQHAVTIKLGNLDNGKDGIHSELVIEAGPPGIPPISYGPTRFNLVSTPARNALVQYMSKRYELDWAGILEAASRLAVMEVREGEPVVDLKDYAKSPEKWLLPPFVLDDQATFLFADGGSGKSLFALALLLTIQLDTPGFIGRLPTHATVGLYLDWESTAQEHAERYRLLCAGAGVDPTTVSLLYRRCDSPLVEQVSQLQRYIAAQNVGFVVIDSVVAACNGEAEHSDTARQFFGALRKLKVPSLCVSHTTKENDRSHKPFGSTFWNNLARNTWEIQRQQDEGSDQMNIALYNRKVNAGKRHKPIGYTLAFTESTITLRAGDVMAIPEFAASASVPQQLRSLLAHGRMSFDNLLSRIEVKGQPVKADTVTRELRRYKDEFQHFDDDTWGLSQQN